MGLTNPIGAKISQVVNNNDGTTTNRPFTILGIVKDFNFQSLRDEITPLVIFNRESFGKRARSQYVAARLKPYEFNAAIQKIETKWKEFIPEQPFKYEFLDDNLNQGYADEQRSGKMFAVFSGLAIIIACVGLFGLSAYMASLRTKEIGIRKVLGSSVREVVILLSKDFTKLVVIAFVLAVPLSWWMMDTWLKGFAYRVNLGVASFLIAGILAFSIALLTVSYQSIKAAMLNPAKSLKQE
jgi:putative ABC transport system permease protein